MIKIVKFNYEFDRWRQNRISKLDIRNSKILKIQTQNFLEITETQCHTCSLDTGDGGIIITSLGFELVDSLRSLGSNLLIEVSEDEPKPESEVADAIITSFSEVELLLSVVSMVDYTDLVPLQRRILPIFCSTAVIERMLLKFFRQFARFVLIYALTSRFSRKNPKIIGNQNKNSPNW